MDHKFSGEQLRIARMFYGLSLQDVAEKIGNVTKQYLQQLEKNVKEPSDEMLMALSEILNVESDFFYFRDTIPLANDQCHFRKLKSTTATVREQVCIHGELLSKLVSSLDEKLNLPDVNFIRRDIVTNEDIERAAEDCRTTWNLGKNTPIKNIVITLENAGAVVSYFKSIPGSVDAFSFEKKRPIIIRNTAKDSVCRMRFDLAHECGHIVMHDGIETGDSETEAQANRFAGAFLLPRQAFLNEFYILSQYRIQWGELVELKKRWKVSLAAIFRRALDLGIMDAVRYRNACISLRKNGWSQIEPGDESVEQENAVIIKKSIEILKNKNKIYDCLKDLKVKSRFVEYLIDINLKDAFGEGGEYSNVVKLYK